jgi:peptidoglycan/xylan/chitin deacetylase (PgdA/CDA1 family)
VATIRRIALRSIAETAALVRVRAHARSGLRILTYHSIGGAALGDRAGLFSISPQQFRRQIDLLQKQQYGKLTPLLPLQLSDDDTRIVITFDDGYRDNLTIAAPLLQLRQIPFTVFVTTNHVRQGAPGFMNPNELRELASYQNVIIGAHGLTHRPLTQCTDVELKSELNDSKRYLEDLLAKPVTALSYPFGAVDARVRAAAQRAGYEVAASTRFDINKPGRDKLMLCRTTVERDDNSRALSQKLRGDWDWFRWRHLEPVVI